MNKTAALKFPRLTTSSQKRALKRITINLTSDEAQNLEKYCEQTGKLAIDVIRELIQALP
ncbi:MULTISPECIES: CopG family transcriptional regulator [unclassified Nostoc]|uniref:CopG family transcriptional regulator n=1 Tax=unclassified Nostoc TaxID=2593658 RepID=UPI000B953BEA|nr:MULTISPECIES: CopG family transcriptional regulator [unclassified Nostoc]MDZ7967418.1 CopG family transcriptional regulator [Nostoc sp. DedSLP03]MDZ8033087.1 CopG family transcriptional regulator [Nostoc sp. DedSLP04]MDZ8213373.1 CopG family transcriptional regulator [Nostoc sp. ChiSLP03a]OYD96587.1 CopG family transcriptional regulator [Nostoc sp. 'Peltigera membranacea cyanobiont' 210A]PHM08636.1 CopG family transcriptional regulator [Nostoc sp. 'Peltigera malacea cyanobiont' DB3992]